MEVTPVASNGGGRLKASVFADNSLWMGGGGGGGGSPRLVSIRGCTCKVK